MGLVALQLLVIVMAKSKAKQDADIIFAMIKVLSK